MTSLQLKQELIAELPDSIVNAVGVAHKDATDPNNYHEAICIAREELKLPPWHPFTLLAKLEGSDLVTGRNFALDNQWIARKGDRSVYYPKFHPGHEDDWVTFDIRAQLGERSSKAVRVSVHPEKGLVWNHTTEYPVVKLLRVSLDGEGTPIHGIPLKGIINEAEKLLYGDEEYDGIPMITYHIREIRHNPLKQLDSLASEADEQLETETAQIVDEQEKEPKKNPLVTQVVSTTKILYPEDIEAINTMFDVASVQIANLGATNTVQRWRQLMDRLRGKEPLTNE